MADKVHMIVEAILGNLADVSEITRAPVTQSYEEYFFLFRKRPFSVGVVSRGKNPKFFAYPKWKGDLKSLIQFFAAEGAEEDQTATFAEADGQIVAELFEVLRDKYSGVDDLLLEIGLKT